MPSSYTSLSDLELGDLARGGDLQARDTLALRYQPWAWKVARRYANMGVDLEDLFAEAMVGILEAASKFDGALAGFRSYSAFYLSRRLGLMIGRDAYPATLSYNACLVQAKCHNARARLKSRLHREPAQAEVAAEAGVENRWVEWVEQVTRAGVVELDAPPQGEDGTPGRSFHLPSHGAVPGDRMEEVDRASAVASAMEDMDPRHAKILRAVFGFEGQPDRSLTEIGVEFGCTKERIRQIRGKALTRVAARHGELLSEYHPSPAETKAPAPLVDLDTAALLAREREAYRQRQAAREAA